MQEVDKRPSFYKLCNENLEFGGFNQSTNFGSGLNDAPVFFDPTGK